MRRAEWAERLRAAQRMGIAPEAFWRLSLVEWRALTQPAEPQALSRADFETLAREHPDE